MADQSKRWRLRQALGASVYLALAGGVLGSVGLPAPAFADEHHDRDRRPPPRHEEHRWGPPAYYNGPPAYYAPPPVVYAPQPSPYGGLNLMFNIR